MAGRDAWILSDQQWGLVRPLLPQHESSARGGRPRTADRPCFDGILWVLHSGARWKDLPSHFPSPSTCWRRLAEWEDAGVFVELWHAFIKTLDERSLVDWEEVLLDGSFAPAKKGRRSRENQAWKRYELDGGGRWPRNSFGLFRLERVAS